MESEEARGPGLPGSGETSSRQGEENYGTRIEVGVGGQKMTKMQTPPPHSLVSSDTQGWQLWVRQDRGQEEGLWEMGKESKHDRATWATHHSRGPGGRMPSSTPAWVS